MRNSLDDEITSSRNFSFIYIYLTNKNKQDSSDSAYRNTWNPFVSNIFADIIEKYLLLQIKTYHIEQHILHAWIEYSIQ